MSVITTVGFTVFTLIWDKSNKQSNQAALRGNAQVQLSHFISEGILPCGVPIPVPLPCSAYPKHFLWNLQDKGRTEAFKCLALMWNKRKDFTAQNRQPAARWPCLRLIQKERGTATARHTYSKQHDPTEHAERPD